MNAQELWKVIVYNKGLKTTIKPRIFKNLEFAINWANRVSYYTGCVTDIVKWGKSDEVV